MGHLDLYVPSCRNDPITSYLDFLVCAVSMMLKLKFNDVFSINNILFTVNTYFLAYD